MNAQLTGGVGPTEPDPGAVALMLAPHAFLVASAVLAYLLARRDRRHRPVAIALVAIAIAEVLHLALRLLVLVPARAELGAAPYAGFVRAIFHVTEGCYLVSVVALPWLAWETFTEGGEDLPPGPGWRRRALLAVAAWAAVLLALVLGYPTLRGDVLRQVYLGAELAALFVCVVAIAPWLRRSPWTKPLNMMESMRPGAGETFARVAQTPPPSPRWYTSASVLVLVAGDAVLLAAGAWRHGLFGAVYQIQQAGLLGLYFVIVCMHVFAIVSGRRAP